MRHYGIHTDDLNRACLHLPAVGWWSQSISVTGGSICGLRDFPAIPNGEGVARMLCGGSAASGQLAPNVPYVPNPQM